MPESMFGRPSHLLSPEAPMAFKDFRFNSIGKQPELLSRISLSQPEHSDYHSPTPSPTSTPLPPSTSNNARLTLFQQLAGSDSSTMPTWPSQSNASLASRIQMNTSPSNDINIPDAPHGTTTGPSPPRSVRLATEDANLIPPVEFLPQLSDSSPPSPASLALTLGPVDSPTSSTLLINTATNRTSRVPTPISATNVASGEQTERFPSSTDVDVVLQNSDTSPSSVSAIDSLVTQQERLQVISASLASLAPLPPPPPPPTHTSSPDSSSVTRGNDNTNLQPQNTLTPIVLRRPYPDNQSSSVGDKPKTNNFFFTPIPSPMTLTQEHQLQHRDFIEAVQNLNSALNALHRVQIDSETAFTHQLRAFEERRAEFEELKQVEGVALQKESEELQRKREELNAKETYLDLLEKESKAREDARKGMLARRQAQEEEKRAAEAKKIQETQDRIAAAMKEIMQVEALTLKARHQHQLGQLASETIPDDLPTESQEGMDEEEITAIKSRNDLLGYIQRLRQLHMNKVQKLEECNHNLRRLGEERKKRQVEETDRCGIAEEECSPAHTEAERIRQVQDDKWCRLEAERKRQAVEKEQARLLPEQRAQAHGSRRLETNGQTLEDGSNAEQVMTSQQDSMRSRASDEANSHLPLTTTATNVMSADSDERASASHRTIPLLEVRTGSRGSPSKQKKDLSVSGGVMLAISTPQTRGAQLPPKPLAKPPSSSDHAIENAVNLRGTSLATHAISGETEFHRAVDLLVDVRSTPDHRIPFPRTSKSQTVLDAPNSGSQELNIGPAAGVSPAQQNVNLRHLKRSRGRVEENDSGDRSVRTISVKSEESSFPVVKKEDDDDGRTHDSVPAPLSITPPTSLPRRPAIIPPPRPWKKHHAAPQSASQKSDSNASYPPERNEPLSAKEVNVTTNVEQPRESLSRISISRTTNAPVQLSVPAEPTNSLLLGPVHPEIQSTESRINSREKLTQDSTENRDSVSSESATSHGYKEVWARNDERSTDDRWRRGRKVNSSCRAPDSWVSSSVAPRSTVISPIEPRPIDPWRPQNTRAEPMRATSPTAGRKRPLEFSDNEHGHRARRHRHDDVWIAEEHNRNRVDSYRPVRERRLDAELDERRTTYRAPPSPPPDYIRSYPSDMPRATYDNRTYIPLAEESTVLLERREQSYRRLENDDVYQRHQAAYNPIPDQHHTNDAKVGETYEPITEERMDIQFPDPPLLARMSTTQYFPSSSNTRGRGSGESSRARGDSSRGRGRGIGSIPPIRGGPPLIERLRNQPSSLGDRLT